MYSLSLHDALPILSHSGHPRESVSPEEEKYSDSANCAKQYWQIGTRASTPAAWSSRGAGAGANLPILFGAIRRIAILLLLWRDGFSRVTGVAQDRESVV